MRATPKRLICGLALLAPLCAQAQTLPSGGAYVAGTGSIGSAGATTTINQSSARGIINWQGFSIGAGGTVNFNNGSGATLNRVTGANISSIEGKLNGTGSVFLVNRNGVVIGPGGTVVTGGSFVASTRDVPNSQFMAGGTQEFSGTSSGSVVNNGKIVSKTGDVVLIGQAVTNNGAIQAPNGTAALAAGNQVVLSDASGPAGIYVAPDVSASGNVTNTGSIKAAAAELAAAGGNVYALAGNRNGLIQATGTRAVNGQIWLTAPNGTVSVNATTLAANTVNGAGGGIIANGKQVSLGATANLSASAKTPGQAGGKILVGTSGAGANLAASTRIATGATLTAAGSGTGTGGAIETSGAQLDLGTAHVTAGTAGSWVLDPLDMTIGSAAAGTISSALNSGSAVTEETSATGLSDPSGQAGSAAGSGNIIVTAPISWSSAAKLTLSAYKNIYIDAGITAAGPGSLILTTGNDIGGTSAAGTGVNFNGGAIQFTSQGQGALTINGSAYGLIWTMSQFSAMTGNPSGKYALAQNIDAVDAFSASPFNADFSGVFNGLGNTISNLTVNDFTSSYVGLFGQIAAGGIVENLTLTNALASGGKFDLGAIAGENYGTIENVYVEGSIAGNGGRVGGLVGENDGTIENSAAAGSVTDNGSAYYIGGLVGNNFGTIENSYASVAVTLNKSNAVAGGLVGYSSTGKISGSYATGAVTGTGTNQYLGGLIGNNQAGDVTDCYWDITTSGRSNAVGQGSSSGITGYTTDALAAALPSGFSADVWGDEGGQSTPYLLALGSADQPVFFASNSAFLKDNPALTNTSQVYVVQDVEGLQAINDNLFAHYALAENIDAAGFAFTPIGMTTGFSGILDGLGFDISGLTINDKTDSSVGLFSLIRNGAGVENLGLTDANVTGGGTFADIGALAGINAGIIQNSFASGAVSGTGTFLKIGGLAGENSGTMTNDFADVAVTGIGNSISVGGLAGINSGTIGATYAEGPVAALGSGALGGLVGNNSGKISNSYWDTTSTKRSVGVGEGSSAGVAGLSTDALAAALPAGFSSDFWADAGAQSTPYLRLLSNFDQPVYFASNSAFLKDNPALNNASPVYVVQSMAGLQAINDNLAGDYALTKGLNAANFAFSPIGESLPFTGIFDGLGNTISNLTINDPSDKYVGLFGKIDPEGVVENLGLIGGSVTGGAGTGAIGALAGYNRGTLQNDYENASVGDNAAGQHFAGGLVGWNFSGKITNSAAAGAVKVAGDQSDIGGLVGLINFGTISNDYATGAVMGSGNGAAIGGLVGTSETGLVDDFATGLVTATGTGSNAGALVGNNSGGITSSYWDTQTSGQSKAAGTGPSTGAKGLTTDALAKALPAGFSAAQWRDDNGQSTPYLAALSFVNEPVYFGSNSTFLADNPKLNNTSLVYVVQSVQGLQAINSNLTGDYAMINDIYATNIAFAPIGETTPFTGIFDGLGNLILSLTINDPNDSNVGLFGQVGATGAVENLGLRLANISASKGTGGVGALVGTNRGTVIGDSAYGTVSGISGALLNIGGLVGNNYGTIADSFTANSVSGKGDFMSVGGLVGFNQGPISNSYAIGPVTGSGDVLWVGGLVGYSIRNIADSYSTGAVKASGNQLAVGGFAGSNYATITDSYWNTQTSGRNNGVGETGSSAINGVTGYTTDALAKSLPKGFSANVWADEDGQSTPYLLTDASDDQPVYFASNSTFLKDSPTLTNASLAYVVQDASGLQAINDGLASDYALAGNIDAADFAFSPIGETTPFTGIFDGLGHSISDLTIDDPADEYVGLFGQVGANGVVRNTAVVGANITGGNDQLFIGELAGRNNGTFADDTAVGQVTAFVGQSGGVQDIGGLVGINDGNGTIKASEADVLITGSVVKGSFGGLAGANSGLIEESDATGAVAGTGLGAGASAWIGGLVGSNLGTIKFSFAQGSAAGDGRGAKVGGLVGYNFGSIDNAYATGAVSGNAFSTIGGFVGFNQGGATLADSFATGLVSGGQVFGGFAGGNNGSFADDYWDITSSKQSKGVGTGSSNGLTGIITDALAKALPTGFSSAVWGDENGQSTPYLLADPNADQPVFFGTGSTFLKDNPVLTHASRVYVVQDVEGLQAINDNLGGDFALAGNINAANAPFSPIGENSFFTGILDGLGYSIANLTINDLTDKYVGLFGLIGSGGKVANLGLSGVKIASGQKSEIGAIAGMSDGRIDDSFASGAVTGTGYLLQVGGLVGENGGRITNSYSTVAVTGNGDGSTNVGGLAGLNTGTIDRSYAAGKVVGNGAGTATGSVVGAGGGTLANIYWDTQTTARGNAVGLGVWTGTTGLTTNALAAALPVGFSSSVWGDDGGQTTPYLLADAGSDQQVYFASNSSFLKNNPKFSNANLIYVVQTAAGLQAVNNNLAGAYAQIAGFNAAGFAFSPIGETNPFTGIFDGLDNTIASLGINGPSDANVGLFGEIGAAGVVKNVLLENASITGGNGNANIGALAGSNRGTVFGSFVSGTVKGTGRAAFAGGLVGFNSNSAKISESLATDAVIANGDNAVAGGLSAYNAGKIANSYATGAITALGRFATAGGLIGDNFGVVTDSYTTSRNPGGGNNAITGGLIGYNNTGTVTNSYWDTDTAGLGKGVGQGNSTGVTGLTTDKLASALPTGFSSGVWADANGQSTPYLLALSAVDQPVYFSSRSVFLRDNPSLTNADLVDVVQSDPGMLAINGKLTGAYALVANLDAAGFAFSPIGKAGFTGIFDGLGNVISNLTMNDNADPNVGLFGKIGTGGMVENIGLANAKFYATRDIVDVGGLAGTNDGTIRNGFVTGTITGDGWVARVGGLAGVDNGTIIRSYADATVTGGGDNARAGGLVGELGRGTIADSDAAGEVIGFGNFVAAGGLVGNGSGKGGKIEYSYATSAVKGIGTNPVLGGFAGEILGTEIIDSYWDITSSGRTNGVGRGSSNGVTGYTTDFLASALPTGFSAGIWGDEGGQSTPYLLALDNADQPVYFATGSAFLKDNPTLTSATQVGVVQDVEGLQAINDNLAGSYALANDIAAGNFAFTPIAADGEFTGNFDGLGHAISNLTINDATDGAVGLFARTFGGVMENLALLNAHIASTNTRQTLIGALAGDSFDRIENSYASGTVTARGKDAQIGGLVGENWGTIAGSEADVAIADAGTGYLMGGLAGYNLGTIRNSYAAGTVTKDFAGMFNNYVYIGGLAGSNDGSIIDSYASTMVSADPANFSNSFGFGGLVGWNRNGTITNSYYDITTSGQSKAVGKGDTAGVTGLTSAQLTNALPTGFSPAIWANDNGQSLPYLLALSFVN